MPASPSTARAINDRLALRLLQQDGPLTATQLKTLTGLSRPTVADLVDRLQDAGLVRVVGESGSDRRGPNARLYGIVADRAHLAALDVRTDSVAVVVADLLGVTLAEATLPIGSDTGTRPAVERAVAMLERTARAAGTAPLHSVGIGAPGLIDPVTGELRNTAGLPAWHRGLVRELQQRLSATVLVENETNLAAVAEHRIGAARDRDTFVLLWLGHGIGAAVMLDGTAAPWRLGRGGGDRLPAGARHLRRPLGGQLRGRVPLPGGLAPRSAGWPRTTASGHGARGGRRRRSRTPPPRSPYGPRCAPATGTARRSSAALADRLALGAASVVSVLDPGCLVLAGEVGRAGGDALAARVEERLARMSPLRTEVRAGTLGGGAVLRGALFAAREAAQDVLFGAGG